MNVESKWLFRGLIIIVVLLVTVASWKLNQQSVDVPQDLIGVLRVEDRKLPSFQLQSQQGDFFTENNLQGKWSLIFLGYTSCPDICPATLAILNSVHGKLEQQRAELLKDTQVVFVSVDPARDTVEDINEYLSFFNKDFIGLTGTKEQIDHFVLKIGGGYVLDEETAPGEYLVAHSSAIFLIAPDLKITAAFSQPHLPETISQQYQKIRTFLGEE